MEAKGRCGGHKGKFKPRHYRVPGICLGEARRAYAELISLSHSTSSPRFESIEGERAIARLSPATINRTLATVSSLDEWARATDRFVGPGPILRVHGGERRTVTGSASVASLVAQMDHQIDRTRWPQRAPVQALFNQKGGEMRKIIT
jgi:hypothetical protein